MPRSGNISVTAAPRVSVTTGGAKAGPAVSVRTPEMGSKGSIATKFSSRGLEAFRNPGFQVSVKGSEGQASAKMRIDSSGKPVSSPIAKAEFSRPEVQNKPRKLGAYAFENAFTKLPLTESSQTLKIEGSKSTPSVAISESANPTNGGKTVNRTSEQIRALTEQTTEHAVQQITRITGQIQQRTDNETRARIEKKSVVIVRDYKSKSTIDTTVSQTAQIVEKAKKSIADSKTAENREPASQKVELQVPKEAKAVPVSDIAAEISRKTPDIITTSPIDIGEVIKIVKAEVPDQQNVATRIEKEAFQQDLARIKQELSVLFETDQVKTGSTLTYETVTVLPDAKPLPVPEVIAKPQSLSVEFGNLLRKRQKEKLQQPLSVTAPVSDQQLPTLDKVNALTAKTYKKSFLAGLLQFKVKSVTEKVKEKAKLISGYVGKYAFVIDWDELLNKKNKTSAYEEITANSKAAASAILNAQSQEVISQNISKSIQPINLLQTIIKDKEVTVARPTETSLPENKPILKNTLAQQQEAVSAAVLPNTQPINSPEAIQQLQSHTEQEALHSLGSRLGIVVFETKKDDMVKLILDKEAKNARKQAIERSVRNARSTSDDTVTGAAVVAASEDKHTPSLLSGAAKSLGLQEDGSENTLWNRIGAIEALPQKEILGRALKEEDELRPVAFGENGSSADEKDLALVRSNVKRKDEFRLVA